MPAPDQGSGKRGDDALAEARRRIRACADSGDDLLDLGDLRLERLPDELRELKQLRTLALGGRKPIRTAKGIEWKWDSGRRECRQLTDVSGLAGLTSLTSLNLSACDQLTDVSVLARLTSLTSLDLAICKQLTDVSVLASLTSLTSLDLSGWEQLTDVSVLASLTSLSSLSLSGCRQLTDVSGLAGLTSLSSLDLRECRQLTDVSGLAGLTSLTSLDLAFCKQLTDVSVLARLTSLTSLDLSGCRQLRDVSVLARLPSLSSLNLSGCDQLTDVSCLAGLTSLSSLDLRECKQLRDASGLAGLTSLTSLDLGFCKQFRDVSVLARLTSLTSLDLSGCEQLTDVSVLARLTSLTSLKLGGCDQLTNVSVLAGLTSLSTLNLWGCYQLTDVSVLSCLTSLSSLDLGGCEQLTNVSVLAGLTSLSSLNLWRCDRLTDVSVLANLTSLTWLSLSGCRGLAFTPIRGLLNANLENLQLHNANFTDLPEAVCGEREFQDCLADVRAYYADIDAGAEEDAEIKVFVLGNSSVGKTQLSRRLTGDPYDDRVSTTHGVRLVDFHLDVPGFEHRFRVNLWDFGGQDIYHGSHALFLQGQALFLLLWTPQTESGSYLEAGLTLTNHPLAYWFDYLREMAGSRDQDGKVIVTNPVLLIQSKCESEEEQVDPPVLPSRNEFPYLYQLSFAARPVPPENESRNLDELLLKLKKTIAGMYSRRKQPLLGVGRKKVREAIRRMQHAGTVKTLSVPHFLEECRQARNVSDPEAVLTYLHRTGVLFYRPGLFGECIILDQTWALDAIYAVFTRREELQQSIRQKHGRFTRDDLDRFVWQGRFSVAEQELFVDMMEQCHICFKVRRLSRKRYAEWEYVAPEFLPRWGREHESWYNVYRHSTIPTAAVTAEYAFLHDGIVRSFLAQIGKESADTAEFWKYGCCFYEKTTDCYAIVRCWPGRRGEGENVGTIHIQAWGANARSLLEPLVEALNEMPIGQPPALRRTEGELPHIQRDPDPSSLNRLHITLAKKVFVSYRHSDSKDVVRRLTLVFKKRGWEVVWNEDGLQKEAMSAFVEQVRVIPFLVPVLSRTYLESRCCLSELFGFCEGQQCRFERLSERAVGVILDGVEIDLPAPRRLYVKQLRDWCAAQDENAALQAPKDLKLVQFMQAWWPRMAEVLEHLSDHLLPRGTASVSENDFQIIADTLETRYAAAIGRGAR
jgi:internalin A